MTIEEKTQLVLSIAKSGEPDEDKLQAIRTVLAADDASPKPCTGPSMEKIAKAHINALGVPERMVGYDYLIFAIIKAAKSPDLCHHLHRDLYVQVSDAFHSRPSRVERTIRRAIEVTWSTTDMETLTELYGPVSAEKGKPTNSDFIARMARIVRDEYEGAAES